MSSNLIYIIGAVIIIAVLGLVLTQRRSTATQAPQETSTEQAATSDTVTYADSGFLPAVLKVKLGTTVTFKNDSSEALQVASEPHPIHTGLLGFDAGKGSERGGTYSFTFTKTGSFGYHNHLNPSHTSTVIVE